MIPRINRSLPKAKQVKSLVTASVLGGIVVGGVFSANTVLASNEEAHPPHQHWTHTGMTGAYDAAALRRGFEVYRQVCSVCHSLDYVHFRDLVGHSHTEAQAKALAQSYDVMDGPGDDGEMFERPGKLSDLIPGPYDNEEIAMMANNGAVPPDLSTVSKARHGEADYIFALLTGYRDSPHGMNLDDGLYFNPYFVGGAIAMAPPLEDDGCEYEDDTVPSLAQQAKDVSVFLAWASHPEQDLRHKTGLKMLSTMGVAIVTLAWLKRFRWSLIKTRKISWTH